MKAARERRGIRPVRVRTVLLLAVVVPLAAALYFVVNDISRHRDIRAEAERIETGATSAQALLEAQSAVSSDVRAATALASVSDLGFPVAAIVEALEIDIAGQMGPTRNSFDVALAEIASTPSENWANPAAVAEFLGYAEDIDAQRAAIDRLSITPEDVERLEQGLEASLERATIDQMVSLGTIAVDVPGAARLADLTASGADAAEYFRAVQLQSAALITFSVDFRGETPPDDVFVAAQIAETAWQQLVRDVDPATRAEFEALRAQPDFVAFTTANDAIIAGEAAFAADTALGSIDIGVAAGGVASDMTDVLIEDLGDEAARISDEAVRGERNAMIVGAVIALVTLSSVAAAVTMIVRPLRYLEQRAHHISAGDLDVEEQDRLTLREAAVIDEAMDDMVRNLSVIERQAEALSAGQLDAASLQESAAGRLGDSLRQSVDQLAELTSRLDHQARHDILTGLPNRAAAMEAIDAALVRRRSRGGHLALLFIDLDDFKRINDDLGHAAGDAVLVETAARLGVHTRDRDLVARLGGDEFIVIIDDLDDHATAISTADRIAEAMAEPIVIDGASITSTASVGVGWSDDSVASGEQLLHRADLAVYQAKALGRSRVEVFDEDLQDADDHRRQVEHELREALAGSGLELWYQPIIDLPSHRVWGFEALLRWRTEDGELRMPDTFIPIAEQSNLIVAVDTWVLTAGFETLSEWQAHPDTRDLHLAANISTRNMTGGRLGEVIGRTAPADLDLARLSLEVTETGLLEDFDAATATVRDLERLGIGVAIDDFGTGHSSVARLRGLPVNRLKVDRSYVSACESESDRSILRTLASLAEALELEVVGEGVETPEQARMLASLGYTHAQGYHYARPMPGSDVAAWLAAHNRAGLHAG